LVISSADNAPFEFGTPTYHGSGCPDGTVKIVTASDGDSWSVLLSDFIAETSDDDNFARASCNMAVSLDVKQGKRIGIYKSEYRGFTYVSDGGKSTFNAEFFFAGHTGELKERSYSSDESNIYIKNHVKREDAPFCNCGESTIFRINTSITARKEDGEDDVIIGFDSIDQTTMGRRFTFHIIEEDC